MGLKLGAALKKLEKKVEGGLKKLGHDLKKDSGAVDRAADKGWGNTAGLADTVKDAFIDAAAESIGVAELVGLRYPVSKYEFKVSDGLTRGSRIDDPNGFNLLKQQGFKSTVDLTLEGTKDAELAPKAGLHTLNVKILDNSAPTMKQMKQFLDFATTPANSPCYVHCEAGKGRTGVATACYRIAVQGWTPAQALAEGKKLGLVLPNQVQFVEQFGADVKAGKIRGYPKAVG